MEEPTIINNPDVLGEDFVPSALSHRDGQLKALRDSLKPLAEGRAGRSAFLHGDPGTGKTCVSLFMLDELSREAPVWRCYVNCWQASSRFKILYTLLERMGKLLEIHRKGMPADELLDSLKRMTSQKPLVAVLDEVDQLEDDKVLYDLAMLPNTALVLVSNSSTALYRADPRVRSRLASAEDIHFPPYTQGEVAAILQERSRYGLVPGAVKQGQLERLASLSGGDARAAIGMLRAAAERAETEGMDSIPDAFLKAPASLSPPAGTKALSRTEELNEHQKLLLELIKESGSLGPSELQPMFEEACAGRGLPVPVDRTRRKYLERLSRAGLIKSSGKGKKVVYSS